MQTAEGVAAVENFAISQNCKITMLGRNNVYCARHNKVPEAKKPEIMNTQMYVQMRMNYLMINYVMQIQWYSMVLSNTNTRLEEAQLPLCLVTYCFFSIWVTSDVYPSTIFLYLCTVFSVFVLRVTGLRADLSLRDWVGPARSNPAQFFCICASGG